jgi:hypothetical protein
MEMEIKIKINAAIYIYFVCCFYVNGRCVSDPRLMQGVGERESH